MKLLLLALLLLLPVRNDAQIVSIEKPAYRSWYNVDMQCPQQVLWTLHAADIDNAKREPGWRFVADVPHPLALARHGDFNRSGYHRGHLCPAKDRSFDKAAMRLTFGMSNIAPQTPLVNLSSWKQTEETCRRLAALYDSVVVIACPVFLDRDTLYISSHRLAVPHAFFKAVWLPANDSVLAAWFIFNN